MEITIPSTVEDKTDVQLQNEALNADRVKTEKYEEKLLLAEKLRQSKDTVTTAKDLSSALLPITKGANETITINLKMENGKRPEVTFSGFWNGRLIQSAMNSIARCYRQQKRILPITKTTTK